MKKAIKAKWVKALRSGKFGQIRGEMKNKDGFCCLGLLRHIVHPASRLEDSMEYMLHEKHLQEFGITNDQQHTLSRLNDGYTQNKYPKCDPHSFEQIAEFIEKHL